MVVGEKQDFIQDFLAGRETFGEGEHIPREVSGSMPSPRKCRCSEMVFSGFWQVADLDPAFCTMGNYLRSQCPVFLLLLSPLLLLHNQCIFLKHILPNSFADYIYVCAINCMCKFSFVHIHVGRST